jgi:hypothetical protein
MMLRLWRDHCSAYGVTIVPLASSLLRCASYCSYAAPLPYIITFCSNIFPSYFCASLSPVAFSSIASPPSLRLTSLRFTSLHLATPRHLSLVISSHFYYSSLPSSSIPRYRSSPPPSLTLLTSHSFITSHLYYSSLPSSSIPRYRSSPLPPRSYLLAISPVNSIAYHSSSPLPIAPHPSPHLAPGISWTCSCALHGPLMPPLGAIPITLPFLPTFLPSFLPSFPHGHGQSFYPLTVTVSHFSSLPLTLTHLTLNLLRAYPPFKEKLYFLLFPPVFLTFLTHTTHPPSCSSSPI